MSTILEGFRLSPQQKRRWLASGGAPARARCLLRLDGALAPARLEAALERTVLRHEILRTVYQQTPGVSLPVQGVEPAARLAFSHVDLTGRSRAARQRALERLWRTVGTLAPEPALGAILASLAAGEHRLLLSLPALSCDARTLRELAAELGRADAGAEAEAPLQYLQFAEWQNGMLEGDGATIDETTLAAREFWLRHPARALAPLRLAAGRLEARGSAAAQTLEPPAGIGARVAALAERLATPPAAVVAAAWTIAMLRLAGEEEGMTAWIIDGRTHEVLAGTLGAMTCALPSTAALAGEPSFAETVQRMAAALAEATPHLDALAATEPAQPAVLAFEHLDWPAQRWADGVVAHLERLELDPRPYQLVLSCWSAGSSLGAVLQAGAQAAPLADLATIGASFLTLLEAALAHPERPASALELVPAAERRRLLVELNDTAEPLAEDLGFHRLFERRAALTPAAPAVVWGTESLSFAELDARANQLAHRLRRLGVGPEVVVGLCLERSVAMVVGVLGILKAGGAYLPLDPTAPPQRLAVLIEAAGARVVVGSHGLEAALPAGDSTPGDFARVRLDAEAAELAREPSARLDDGAGGGNLAYVLFTSGSTGKPKGVMVEHRSVAHLAHALGAAVYAGLGRPLRVAVNAALSFDASVKQLVQLAAGHTLCVVPEPVRADGRALAAFVETAAIDVLDATPGQLEALLEAGLPAARPLMLLVGGEALSEALWSRLTLLAGRWVWNLYGPTECTVDSTACRLRPELIESELGGPLANVRVYVLDRRLRPVPAGAPGELAIAGAGVARGYAGRPTSTAERFVPDPFTAVPGGRLYRSGDRAVRLPAGGLRFLGRIDHQLKLRGWRIEPGEIEAVLGEHPQVRQAVVVLREHAGEKLLAAYVVARRPAPELAAELREHLRRRLPEAMVPTALSVLPRLPLTERGKLDRAALPAPLLGAATAPYAPPRSRRESEVAAIWQQVLELERVGRDDNFFDLGGQSLRMLQVHHQIEAKLGLAVSIVELFRHPTVRELAALLEASSRPELVPSAPSAFASAAERARLRTAAHERRREHQKERRIEDV